MEKGTPMARTCQRDPDAVDRKALHIDGKTASTSKPVLEEIRGLWCRMKMQPSCLVKSSWSEGKPRQMLTNSGLHESRLQGSRPKIANLLSRPRSKRLALLKIPSRKRRERKRRLLRLPLPHPLLEAHAVPPRAPTAVPRASPAPRAP